GAAAGGLSEGRDGADTDTDGADAPRAEDPLDAPGAREVGEQSVWSFGDRADDAGTGADGTSSDGGSPGADPSGDDADQERR
ncbi:MAG TPA: hypothetical protein K8W24_07295, partial [Brachybacterium paraconglomeratum]|nr:hypothetical protein [Brachybacterium paraconglomeratum]